MVRVRAGAAVPSTGRLQGDLAGDDTSLYSRYPEIPDAAGPKADERDAVAVPTDD